MTEPYPGRRCWAASTFGSAKNTEDHKTAGNPFKSAGFWKDSQDVWIPPGTGTTHTPHLLCPRAFSGCRKHLVQDCCHRKAALLCADPPPTGRLSVRQRHTWKLEMNWYLMVNLSCWQVQQVIIKPSGFVLKEGKSFSGVGSFDLWEIMGVYYQK